jgi:hypothetical protein
MEGSIHGLMVVLSWHLPERSEENHRTARSRYVSWMRFKCAPPEYEKRELLLH